MLSSRIAIALAIAFTALSGIAMAAETAPETVNEEVLTATSRPKLPTEAELAKAKADNSAKPVITPLTTQQQIEAWHTHAPKAEAGDETTGKRQIHSEMGVSVGTGGYSSFYAASLIPFGENGTLGIAIGQTDFGRNGSPYGGHYGGYSGGYYANPYGHSGYGWGQRGGTSQSLALSLDMTGTDKGRPDTPEGCAPGFRDGERYIEPLWVTQRRGVRRCESLTNPR